MRLLMISSEFPPGPGGIGTHAFQLAKYFSVHGSYVSVISPQEYASEEEIKVFNEAQSFEITRLPSYTNKPYQVLERLILLRKTIRHFNPELVVVSGGKTSWAMPILLNAYKTPWVLVGHGTEFGSRSLLPTWLTRVSGNAADAVICVSEYTRQALHAIGINKPPVFVIHNGADHTLYYPLPDNEIRSFRMEHGAHDKFVLLTVGKVYDRKGQEVVIRALPLILKRHPNVVYWMVGMPQEQQKLSKIAQELGVSEHIRFLGLVSNQDLLKYYNACDLFVMTSRQLADGNFEGFGIAVIEAALCGKAAVVSDNSGLAEAVKHGETGLIVPQNDPVKTSEAVISLMEDRQKFEKLSTQAYHNAIENQTWDKVGERYSQVFEKIVSS